MNVLHLFSDQRWTGPAEPVLTLCQHLEQRGHRVILAYTKPVRYTGRTVASHVKERNITATDRFRLNRYLSIKDTLFDLIHLPRFLREQNIQVLNTHLSHDHVLGSLAARRLAEPPIIVRTDHKRDSFRANLMHRFFLPWFTDGVITFSDAARGRLLSYFRFPEERVARMHPAVDSKRFHPVKGSREFRRELAIADEHVVVGIVARYQRHRRMGLFFDAFAKAVKAAPCLKALIVGHGEAMEETVHTPVRQMGLEGNVLLAGYVRGQLYLDALASMDLFAFLIAGSDGTGRALREAMAMAKPVLVNRVGMLPEMVEDGVSGVVFNDNADDLADKLIMLARDKTRRQALGDAARRKAERDFSPELQAQSVEAFYDRLLVAAQQRAAGQ